MNIKPTGPRVLLKIEEDKTHIISGKELLVAGTKKEEKRFKFTVIDIGPEVRAIEIGDKVILFSNAHVNVLKDKGFGIVTEAEIIGIIANE